MSTLESVVVSYVVNSLWQVPIVFAAGWLAARALRSLGPAAEHRVWVTALILQAFLPAASLVPVDALRRLLEFARNSGPGGQPHVSVIVGPGMAFGNPQFPRWLFAVALTLYGAVTCWLGARFLWRMIGIRRLRRSFSEVRLTAEAAVFWGRCGEIFGVPSARLGTSTQVYGPVTIGIRCKLVLVPSRMLETVPEAELRTAIAHEFAHMQRNDFAKNLFYELIAIPVRFHPVVALTHDRLTETREMICDELASGLADRHGYARSLLRLASLLVHRMPARTPHVIGIFDATTFERRVMRLTHKTIPLSTARRFTIAAACAVLATAICATTLAFSVHVDAFAAVDEPHASKGSGPVSVPADIMAKQVVHKVPPVYPPDAKKTRIQGKVELQAVIGKTGEVEQLKAVNGPGELQQSALDAVRQWTYRPFLVNGAPVDVKTTINVIYSLRQ